MKKFMKIIPIEKMKILEFKRLFIGAPHVNELDKIMKSSLINRISNIWLTNFGLLFVTFYRGY